MCQRYSKLKVGHFLRHSVHEIDNETRQEISDASYDDHQQYFYGKQNNTNNTFTSEHRLHSMYTILLLWHIIFLSLVATHSEQEGQHPLTGQRAANFRLLANQ